jgi:hypothetical protein
MLYKKLAVLWFLEPVTFDIVFDGRRISHESHANIRGNLYLYIDIIIVMYVEMFYIQMFTVRFPSPNICSLTSLARTAEWRSIALKLINVHCFATTFCGVLLAYIAT